MPPDFLKKNIKALILLSCCSYVSSDGNSIFMFWGNKHLSFQIEEFLLVSSWLRAQIQVSPSSLSYGEAEIKALIKYVRWVFCLGIVIYPCTETIKNTNEVFYSCICVFCMRVLCINAYIN